MTPSSGMFHVADLSSCHSLIFYRCTFIWPVPLTNLPPLHSPIFYRYYFIWLPPFIRPFFLELADVLPISPSFWPVPLTDLPTLHSLNFYRGSFIWLVHLSDLSFSNSLNFYRDSFIWLAPFIRLSFLKLSEPLPVLPHLPVPSIRPYYLELADLLPMPKASIRAYDGPSVS